MEVRFQAQRIIAPVLGKPTKVHVHETGLEKTGSKSYRTGVAIARLCDGQYTIVFKVYLL